MEAHQGSPVGGLHLEPQVRVVGSDERIGQKSPDEITQDQADQDVGGLVKFALQAGPGGADHEGGKPSSKT
jgi:hypothetical protein